MPKTVKVRNDFTNKRVVVVMQRRGEDDKVLAEFPIKGRAEECVLAAQEKAKVFARRKRRRFNTLRIARNEAILREMGGN